ncbi:MAG: hypothetical protein WC966_00345 [Bradymonadales bacterium]
MSNPFGMRDGFKRALSVMALTFFCTSFVPLTVAQDFDFSDSDASDTFNFTEDSELEAPTKPEFTMPNNGKPVSMVFFEPVGDTEQKHLDSLSDAIVDHMSKELFDDMDAVVALPIIDNLNAMDSNTRFDCVNGDTPSCLTDMAKEYNADYIIVGRFYNDEPSRPRITLDLIEVKTNSNKNFVQFDTQPRLRRQEKDLGSALANLFNKEMPAIDTLLGSGRVEESNPLPLGQMISGIIIGVAALGAIGVGVKFGLDAKKNDDKVKKAIKENKASGATFGSVSSQLDAKKYSDDAEKAAMIANVMYASGAVLAVVSVILFLIRPEQNEDIYGAKDLYISPVFTEDGGGIGAGFRF